MRAPFRFRIFALALAAAAAALPSLPGCTSESSLQGGTDTETLTGLMLTAQGNPAAGARVKLIPSGYDPSRPDTAKIRVAVTDPGGRYTFPKAKDAGSFNLLATGSAGDAVFLEALPGDSVPDTLRLGTARMFYVATYGDSYDYQPGMAWFPGTDLLVRCGTDSSVTMKGVPGNLNYLVIKGDAGWRHEFTVQVPGDTLVIGATQFAIDAHPY